MKVVELSVKPKGGTPLLLGLTDANLHMRNSLMFMDSGASASYNPLVQLFIIRSFLLLFLSTGDILSDH